MPHLWLGGVEHDDSARQLVPRVDVPGRRVHGQTLHPTELRAEHLAGEELLLPGLTVPGADGLPVVRGVDDAFALAVSHQRNTGVFVVLSWMAQQRWLVCYQNAVWSPGD